MKKLFETLNRKATRSKAKLINKLRKLCDRIKKSAVDTLLLAMATYRKWKETKSFKTFCSVTLWFVKIAVQALIKELITLIIKLFA